MKSLVIAEKPSVARDIARVLKCGKNISGIPIKRPNPAAFYKRQNPRPLNKKAQKGKTADEREFLPAAYVPDLQRKL